MIRFAPVWFTSGSVPLDPSPLVEGTVVAYQLVAQDSATASVKPVDEVLTVTFNQAPGVPTEVRLNGTQIGLDRVSVTGAVMTVTAPGFPPDEAVAITVKRDQPISFTRLSGELPPGLNLTSGGLIRGALGNVPTEVESYNFTLRASNGVRVRDRTFTIRVAPQETVKNFVPSAIPSPITDESGTFDFCRLGDLKRAESFIRTFEIGQADGDEVLEILPSGVDPEVEHFEGLPPGIRVDGASLRGTISANAPAGRYIFRFGISGQGPASTRVRAEIAVQNELADYTERALGTDWITKSGYLGEVYEGYASAFSVQASLAPIYTLAPNSLPLPKGMRINSRTGDIEGVAPTVADDTLYTFTIRATRLGSFSDRTFSFRVRSLYTTTNVLDVRLKLRNRDQVPMVNRYRELVNKSVLFRRNDPSFGMPEEPYIYLIKGVFQGPFEEALKGDGSDAITKAKDYHGPLELLLGKHKVAVVRNSLGAAVHEVVYRELYDPQAKAGGFSFTDEEVTEERVIHAQSRKTVYATSLRNARLDLVRDCGFPTIDPTMHKRAGVGSAESLPMWMTSPQVANDPSSALGYVPGLVVANTVLGAGEALAAALNADTVLAPAGRQIVLDRYYLYTVSYSQPTTFDGGECRFDAPTEIGFDVGTDGSETPIQV